MLESQGRYVQAYREYERLLTDHAGQIVKLPDGTYTGVRPEVQRRLEVWPADAKQICRDLQESSAAASLQQLESSADPASIMVEAQRWWLTQAAGNAALRCATQLTQTGNIETAGWILRKLTVIHPDLAESLRKIPGFTVKPSPPPHLPSDDSTRR